VNLDVAVTERSTGELSFGAGFSTSDGVLGDVRLRERNLLGRGQDLSANVTLSQRRQNAEISFTEPYFLDRDLAAGFDLFRTRTDLQSESSFDERSTGGTLRMGYPLTENLRHAVRYTLRTTRSRTSTRTPRSSSRTRRATGSPRRSARPSATTGATPASCRPTATSCAWTRTWPAWAATTASSATSSGATTTTRSGRTSC
jgi:outer membrane protein assembly factor BamA